MSQASDGWVSDDFLLVFWIAYRELLEVVDDTSNDGVTKFIRWLKEELLKTVKSNLIEQTQLCAFPVDRLHRRSSRCSCAERLWWAGRSRLPGSWGRTIDTLGCSKGKSSLNSSGLSSSPLVLATVSSVLVWSTWRSWVWNLFVFYSRRAASSFDISVA